MSKLRIVMAGEPIGKGRPRFVRSTGRAYTPEKTARYEERFAWIAQSEMAGRRLFDSAVAVHVDFFVSIPSSKSQKWKLQALEGSVRPTKKPDMDNALKALFDALNKVVWLDDCQVVECVSRKFYSDQPRIEMTIAEIV